MPRRSDFVPSTSSKRARGAAKKEEMSPVKPAARGTGAKGRATATNGTSRKGKGRAKAESDESDGAHEPTGLTSDEESDSELSDASEAFEPDDDDEPEEVEVISVGDSSDDEPPKKKPRVSVSAKPTAKGKATTTTTAKGKSRGRGGAKRVTALGEELDSEDEVELEDGQEVAGMIYPAPKEGRGEFTACGESGGEVSSGRGARGGGGLATEVVVCRNRIARLGREHA